MIRPRAVWAVSALLVVTGLLAGCAGTGSHLAGRVMHRGEPVAGAQVAAVPFGGGVPVTVRTGADGRFRTGAMAPGAYRVTARADTLVAVAGRIPVYLSPGVETRLGLQAVPVEQPRFAPMPEAVPGFGALSGTIRHGGRVTAGAVVNLYLDLAEGLRGPGFQQSLPSGPDGFYALDDVPEGRYHVVARLRRGGATAGPVREGDLYSIASAGPVEVRSRTETRLDLHLVTKERDDAPEAGRLALTGTGLRGRVVDTEGKPAEGVYVYAYRDRTMGHHMPDFRTLPTGPDGTFVLPVDRGRLVYVGARERSGTSPSPGERVGFYEGSPDHGLEIPQGRVVDGIEIVVRKVMGE